MTSPIGLLIVDDHAVVRDGLEKLLSAEKDIRVVGVAADGREAVRLCTELGPQVVLMDLDMPEMDGIEATSAISDRCPQAAVVIMSGYGDDQRMVKAFEAGAVGAISKSDPVDSIIEIVYQASRGEVTVSKHLISATVARMRQSAQSNAALGDAYIKGITQREMEVITLIAQAMSNSDIAEALSLSESTVRNHLTSIYRKLECSSRVELFKRAAEMGLAE